MLKMKSLLITVTAVTIILASPKVLPGDGNLNRNIAENLYDVGSDMGTAGTIVQNPFMATVKDIGMTTYDYQQNGAMGNRVAVDDQGYVHFSWMHSATDGFADRDIYYNMWDPTQNKLMSETGTKVSGSAKAGYTTLGLLSDGRTVVAFHHDPNANNTPRSAVVVELSPQLGVFGSPVDIDATTVPEQPVWPHIVVGADNVIHVIAHVSVTDEANIPYNYRYLYYSRSTDGGKTFSKWKVIAQDAGNDAAIATSVDGKKVTIAWMSAFPITGTGQYAMSGHIKYVESTNSGSTWGSPVNVTKDRYVEEVPNSSEEGLYLGAWEFDLDCAYDAAGNLHLGFGEAPRAYVYSSTDGLSFYSWNRWFLRMTHWCSATKEFTVPSGPYSMFRFVSDSDTIWEIDSLGLWGIANRVEGYYRPGIGCWNPQLAVLGNSIVFTWAGQWDSTDISAAGVCNADIYASISNDQGKTWKALPKEGHEDTADVWNHLSNLTKTHSPIAGVGYTESEEYHSVWPWIGNDSKLQVTYIKDLFSGSVVQPPVQGVVTQNPVSYMYVYIDGIEEIPIPSSSPKLISSSIVGVTPLEIRFTQEFQNRGKVTIRNVAGETIREMPVEKGSKSVIWNGLDSQGRKASKGAYFLEISVGSVKGQGKMVVLR